jgi:hypothetical protein
MPPSAYEIARSIGFSGNEEDFVNAASRNQDIFSLLKDNKMDYGQTELSGQSCCGCGVCGNDKSSGELNMDHPLLKLLSQTTSPLQPVTQEALMQKGREAMQNTKQQHPSEEGFMEFLANFFGSDMAAAMSSDLKEEFGGAMPTLEQLRNHKPTQAQLPADIPKYLRDLLQLTGERGIHVVPDQRFAPEPKVFPISEEVQKAASVEAIQGYITNKLIPEFTRQLAELVGKYEGQDLLRQQRRLVSRLAKLMQYQAKPDSIVPTAIHDEYELSIYKNAVAKQIVARNIAQHDGLARVNSAIAAMNERTVSQQENTKRQAEAVRQANVDKIVDDALECLANDAPTTNVGEGINYLKGLARRSLPADASEAQVLERTGVLADRLGTLVLNKQRALSVAAQTHNHTTFQPHLGRGNAPQHAHLNGDMGMYINPLKASPIR